MRDLLMQGLEEDPADRFSSAIEFKRALMSAASSVVVAPVKELTSGVCPACNAVNADNRKFCGECAESLRTVCLGCNIEMAVWDKICGECGGRQTELQQLATEKAAAVTSSFAKGDWNAVLALDPTNSEGLRLQAAAEKAGDVSALLAKGDWKTTLALDPDNSEGLRLRAAAPISNSIGMTLKFIPSGTSLMGSPMDETDTTGDKHQHTVEITKPFYMQTTVITQGQWGNLLGTKPWQGWFSSKNNVKAGPDYPASYVSWNDAVAYCEKLSIQEGKTYRLPTEAEWEYACRAGTETVWSFGDDEKALGDYAWYQENTWDIDEKYAHQVGLKKPNAFGLYDMHGNVFELCHDFYGEDYYQQSPTKDPQGPASGSSRVLRGGSWLSNPHNTRTTLRDRVVADDRSFTQGFRLVRELD
jgi:formylglycine-generating enzyme required for sulfatase activity